MKVDELVMFQFLRKVMNRLDIAYVATYPPRECGIATFTQDLVHAIDKFTPFSEPKIIAINDNDSIYQYSDSVRYQIHQNNLASFLSAAEYINNSSIQVVSIQHEFGIYGGSDGEYLIPFMAAIKKPIVVTLHTVLPDPNPHQKEIIEEMFGYASNVITMIDKGKEILGDSYKVDIKKVRVVPHGVHNTPKLSVDRVKSILGIADRQVLSTFGLINQGKGIEYVIKALPEIVKKHPNVVYLVIGETHPNVRRYEGEKYRNELIALSRDLGVEENVRFNNRFLPLDELISHLAATDIYITPYLNKGQIVSGTLAYAIGCGKAIISTPYLYAEDVLGDGRGELVPFKDSQQMAEKVNAILEDPQEKARLENATYRYGRRTTWFNVAIDYLDIMDQLVHDRKKVRSIKAISGEDILSEKSSALNVRNGVHL